MSQENSSTAALDKRCLAILPELASSMDSTTLIKCQKNFEVRCRLLSFTLLYSAPDVKLRDEFKNVAWDRYKLLVVEGDLSQRRFLNEIVNELLVKGAATTIE